LQYTIIIPVFNKAALTRNCLRTLRATLEGAGEGEIIVVDNGSSDDTPAMLAEFPWARVIRNEQNLGFAAANNQGAREARGEFLVLLNNDTEAKPGWLNAMLQTAREPGVGAVGARLLFPNGMLQHAGVAIMPLSIGAHGFVPYHDLYESPGNSPYAQKRHDYQVVTGACMVTPRELYLELGGLDEAFWNGYEDVDYCLKLHARGLRVVYDGRAVLTHFESQSGVQRKRRTAWNYQLLAQRWNGRVEYDDQIHNLERGHVKRIRRHARGHRTIRPIAVPPVAVLCHGANREHDAAFVRALHDNRVQIRSLIWFPGDDVQRARDETEVRGDRYVVFVDTRCELRTGWLDELVLQVEFSPSVGAAAYVPELPSKTDNVVYGADARCTLVSMRNVPQHVRLPDADGVNRSVAAFLAQMTGLRQVTRAAARDLATLPPAPPGQAIGDDPAVFEGMLSAGPCRRPGLVSIVMLSWNALEYTKIAVHSIRAHTAGEYEVIVVDNGSGPETVEWLHEQPDIRTIFNPVNRGYAGGNNQALAAARGEYIVLLNNDVIVTEGWLDGLLAAFNRIPGLGVSAPRSNIIAGDQIVPDANYGSDVEMHAFAKARRKRFLDTGYATDRAIGLCLCIDRRVIEEIGGIDERFGVGNFEDDDFCMRVRSAGYKIHVCDDVFIHHFGSKTFAANKVDWHATMRENWTKFAKKWGLPLEYTGGYDPPSIIRGGFVKAQHYMPLPSQTDGAPQRERDYRLVFAAPVADEREWSTAAQFLKRYVQVFGADQPVLFTVAACGELTAQTLGERARRIAQREGRSDETVADIEISDEESVDTWLAGLPQNAVRIETLEARSPSALRRLL
jgi:GT2 family glycosyltransferase